MNKRFEKKLCYYFDALLNTVPFEDRKTDKLLLVESYLPRIEGTALSSCVSNLISISEIHWMLFGEWGECGLVVFLDYKLKEVCRLAFEDSNSTRSWFVKE